MRRRLKGGALLRFCLFPRNIRRKIGYGKKSGGVSARSQLGWWSRICVHPWVIFSDVAFSLRTRPKALFSQTCLRRASKARLPLRRFQGRIFDVAATLAAKNARVWPEKPNLLPDTLIGPALI